MIDILTKLKLPSFGIEVTNIAQERRVLNGVSARKVTFFQSQMHQLAIIHRQFVTLHWSWVDETI